MTIITTTTTTTTIIIIINRRAEPDRRKRAGRGPVYTLATRDGRTIGERARERERESGYSDSRRDAFAD
jgi:hypothetical protein